MPDDLATKTVNTFMEITTIWIKVIRPEKDCYGKDQDLKGEVDPEENGCQDWKPETL
ncbi:MAG: hypothetical protein ACLUE2_06300 [Bacteroides cellulosilyticus]